MLDSDPRPDEAGPAHALEQIGLVIASDADRHGTLPPGYQSIYSPLYRQEKGGVAEHRPPGEVALRRDPRQGPRGRPDPRGPRLASGEIPEME